MYLIQYLIYILINFYPHGTKIASTDDARGIHGFKFVLWNLNLLLTWICTQLKK